jgi:DNA-binding PadR family transcriptional regulator
MTVLRLSENRYCMPASNITDPDPESIHREVQRLQRWGLIQWARQPGDSQRIYHITATGRRFLGDCTFIETSNSFNEFLGFTFAIKDFDVLEKSSLVRIIHKRRAFVYRIIGKIKKSQSGLGRTENARQLALQYHLHRFQGELRWLDDIMRSQGS